MRTVRVREDDDVDIAAAMMREESRDARRLVGRERGGDERFSRPDPSLSALWHP